MTLKEFKELIAKAEKEGVVMLTIQAVVSICFALLFIYSLINSPK